MNQQSPGEIPTATLQPERRASWLYVLPIMALLFVGWLAYQSWKMRGTPIEVQFAEGHGLHADDEVRYRGIVVGHVRSVELASEFDGVIVRANLDPQSRQLARAGTRLWVVRPQVGITGVAGLDTLVGPRYLALLPGDGPTQHAFIGLEDPPIVDSIAPGDLEIVLQSPRRGSMRPGAPVLYRQVPVGTILSVGLDHDAGAVQARVHIPERYTALIRKSSRFWNVGGLDAEVGIRGVSLKLESVETLLAGGVALATPPGGGDIVRNGHLFELAEKPEEAWLAWQPMAMVGSPFLPPGAVMSAPMRAVLGWREGRWIKSDRTQRGWVLQTDDGLLGPADLLTVGDDVDAKSAVLEIAGHPVPLAEKAMPYGEGLVRVNADVGPTHWPSKLQRVPEEPEDCIVVGDRAIAPIPLAAGRLTPVDGQWKVDPAVPFDASWHGACVLARSDGNLIGLLLITKEEARVACLPGQTKQAAPNQDHH
ncbi:MAG: MCE family protein [Phycisphaerales bacterium]|nr:MCE family protein [Phycisphaerales bacterium]